MVIYSSAYNQVTSSITHAISSKYHNYTVKLDDLSAKIKAQDDYDTANDEARFIHDANNFTEAGRIVLVDELRKIQAEQKRWFRVKNIWELCLGVGNHLFNWLIVGDQISHGNLNRDKRDQVLMMSNAVSSMVGWSADNAGPIATLRLSMVRLTELLARIEESHIPSPHKTSYHYEKSEQPGICFADFKVGKGNESRLYIEDLCVFDRRVAVTGDPASGKSTLFKAVKQIMGTWSEGNITFFAKHGTAPYIAMTSQDKYLPPEYNLLELITFKKGTEAEAYRERIIELLKEIKIDSVKDGEVSLLDNLDMKTSDWISKIRSGGQRQKLDVVRLTVKAENKPHMVLMLDEIFTGLNKESIDIIKTMLDMVFPDSQIFVIDHEAKAHNEDGWYNNELHLSNGTAKLLGAPALDSTTEP